ncbi:hypothetical protein TSH100_22930 [Azospirillum sp. TSH100]|uniref:hypothetical protein n=1 Tax=Azospirillum sp. TSH100 TaxID=652764 RepID=UPI000D61036A|nr:hypothetical protein [Azospirillum sp. TSH100]PWC82821.1 hypothetical protein TSH100_22930 [Azospirillum sp. TSH100]QCG86683.1 hypothetical protein E6C72_02415 [Azospirillum sp. TSH100]
MAYASKDLSVLAYANGFTLWHYTTRDVATDVDTAGYFNGAADLLRVGDMLLANCAVGSAAPATGMLVVAASANGTVDVANLTPFGSVNSD